MRSRASTRRLLDSVQSATREHSAQARKAGRIPFQKRVQHRFGVGTRMKSVAELLQFRAQFQVIVDLAVEDDRRVAVVRRDGLVAGCKVDDLQPRRAQRANARPEDALLVRPAMNQRVDGALNPLGIGRPVLIRKTGDTAQIATLLTTHREGNGIVTPLPDTIKASPTESHEIGR